MATRGDASPGLLRRRYSVPETVMRRYRLAQQLSESEASAPPSGRTVASCGCRAACLCCRSLGASRCELRPSSAAPHSPRRARGDAGRMLRAAMRNSYHRAPRAPRPAPCPLSESSDTLSASLCTAQEAPAPHSRTDVLLQDKNDDERSEHFADKDDNSLSYHRPLSIDTSAPSDLLEIVVSETLSLHPTSTTHTSLSVADHLRPNLTKPPSHRQNSAQNINIDEYVSNILVESLNSLTDQLECMNASIGSDRKISIVEKEIKVKLQNTGVNTIVHLSPTSNNQIIFGNEELCNEEGRDVCNNVALSVREELSAVSNNNHSSAEHGICDSFDIQHDNVNQAVLQQIQKLFQDELQNMAPGEYSADIPEISHIEISNVGVFIDDTEAGRGGPASPTCSEPRPHEVIGGVGAGNYFPDLSDNPVVPRFSALPQTDSMEVNTSSSDDADLVGSGCTSLVDSLDDPNSPRSILLRRPYSRRGELVRSAIDVLDLLPENAHSDDTPPLRDKPESFFIGIKDNDCECDKENVNVADRMPETIRQRLHRRHRKREQRMESARRTRARPPRREAPRERTGRARRDVERDCMALVYALIDDVIAKIAQDEYKCMRIKHRPPKMLTSKSDENVASVRRGWKKELDPIGDRKPFKAIKNRSTRFDTTESNERYQVHGKLPLRPPPISDDCAAKRIYQKSEIHDGNKCIEILEILEYVNGSQSSTETTNSEENQSLCTKNRKSRIPVPISERALRSSNGDTQRENNKKWCPRGADANGNANAITTDVVEEPVGCAETTRRSSVGGARFRRVFEAIPEERAGEPRSAVTSPPGPLEARHQATMTSPCSRSAATSPRAPAGTAPWRRCTSAPPLAPCPSTATRTCTH